CVMTSSVTGRVLPDARSVACPHGRARHRPKVADRGRPHVALRVRASARDGDRPPARLWARPSCTTFRSSPGRCRSRPRRSSAGGGGRGMAKRMIAMLALMAALLAALGAAKVRQVRSERSQIRPPPPAAVTTTVARQEQWPVALSAGATVTAVQGVTVSADLPGPVDRMAFDSGAAVRQGDVLAELDTRRERAQLDAALANRKLAGLIVARMEAMIDKGVVSRTDYDRAQAEDEQSAARV